MEIPQLDQRQSVRHADGLEGEWLSLEELAEHEPFKSIKKIKLNTNLRVAAGTREPEVKAAVRRKYAAGAVICRAGEYGSTAFLLLEGTVIARVPERTEPQPVPGRSRWSLGRLARLFERRTQGPRRHAPAPVELGEVSRYAHRDRDRPPAETVIQPGEFFGVDTCINFYPREATVTAAEPCVVIEMLRSVLDTVRESSPAGAAIESGYAAQAVRQELYSNSVFDDLPGAALDELAAASTLLINDEVDDDVIYREGEPADALYLVRAGTVKISHGASGQESIAAYLGRGAVFGLENLLPVKPTSSFTLRCVSHRDEFAPVELKGTVSLGRKSGCSVRFPKESLEVSGLHCRFEEREGEVYLIDNGSKNFTLLNGERVREAIVAAGDVVSIADFVFELISTPTSDTPATAEPRRRATVSGLDSFEVIMVPAAAVRRAARQSPEFALSAASAGRSLQSGAVRNPAHLRDLVDLNLYNSQNTLLIDLDRCTRCDECVRACATAHDGVARFTRDGPRFGKYLVTLACRSCTDPKCMVGCPVGSIRRRDSLEIHIEDWCIGCQRCANLCPFGNINMVELATQKADDPPRLRATVCDLCSGYDGPNCVYACPHDAAIRVNPAAFLSPLDR